MNLNIKICGMRDPGNIIEAGILKPDFMGFIFYPGSPRYAGETLKPEDLIVLPEDIRRVGVFVNSDADKIARTVLNFSLDIVQLHGDETPEFCQSLYDNGTGVIKAFNIKNSEDFFSCWKYIGCTDFFLFDAATLKYGGSGIKFDWRILDDYDIDHPFFLSGGIQPEDVTSILNIENPSFYGIDLNSRFEVKPGLKNIERLRSFISAIRNYKKANHE